MQRATPDRVVNSTFFLVLCCHMSIDYLLEKVCDRHPQESDVKGVPEVNHLAEQVEADVGQLLLRLELVALQLEQPGTDPSNTGFHLCKIFTNFYLFRPHLLRKYCPKRAIKTCAL